MKRFYILQGVICLKWQHQKCALINRDGIRNPVMIHYGF